MDNLPELPFEQVLSYLNLHDRLMLSAVSRSCHEKIANSRVKFLCYSELPSGYIYGKNRWVSGAFTQNFIHSSRFESFFGAYRRSVLSELKHLRLCDLSLDLENRSAFTCTLNSFSQLEELDIIRARCSEEQTFKLSTLTSIHLEELKGIRKLTLDAPKLKRAKFVNLSLSLTLEFIHGESVERFSSNDIHPMIVTKLKNLKYLYHGRLHWIDSEFLFNLKQLKEIHLNDDGHISELFEQKRRLGRADLKIYLCGLLLNGPDDPARNSLIGSPFSELHSKDFCFLAKNRSRLADEILLYRKLDYSEIMHVDQHLETDLLKLLSDLCKFIISSRVWDAKHFLNLLKNCEKIVELTFDCDQPQGLFDRLPEHCAVQKLTINKEPSDLRFLFRLKHLTHLNLDLKIDSKPIRRAFRELPFLTWFKFKTSDHFYSSKIKIEIVHGQFRASIRKRASIFSDLNSAIKFVFEIESKEIRDRLARLLNG